MEDKVRVSLSNFSTWIPKASWLGFLVIGGILFYLILPPLFFLVRVSFESGGLTSSKGGFTLEHYKTVSGSANSLKLLSNTLIFAIGSSLIGLLIGGDLPGSWKGQIHRLVK